MGHTVMWTDRNVVARVDGFARREVDSIVLHDLFSKVLNWRRCWDIGRCCEGADEVKRCRGLKVCGEPWREGAVPGEAEPGAGGKS